jgi:hypothetical protein
LNPAAKVCSRPLYSFPAAARLLLGPAACARRRPARSRMRAAFSPRPSNTNGPVQPACVRRCPLSPTSGTRPSSPTSSRGRAGLPCRRRLCLGYASLGMARTPRGAPRLYLSHRRHPRPTQALADARAPEPRRLNPSRAPPPSFCHLAATPSTRSCLGASQGQEEAAGATCSRRRLV